MSDVTKISFAMKDTVLGDDLSPDNTTLPLLSEFIEQVMIFLRGSGRPNLDTIKAGIKKGSLAVVAENEAGLLDSALKDYDTVMKTHSIEDIDPARAKIIEFWQNEAKRSQSRNYQLYTGDDSSTADLKFLRIAFDTDFKKIKEIWVDVELYLYGKVYDLGGKNKPNVHIELENGNSLKIGTKATLLTGDNENRLYKDQLVRVRAKKNIKTEELEDEKLISFEYYNPVFDEDEYNKLAKKTKAAWRSVKNISSWVEDLRGSGA